MKLQLQIGGYILIILYVIGLIPIATTTGSVLFAGLVNLFFHLKPKEHDLLVLLSFILSSFLCIWLYLWYLAKPLHYLLAWIQNLAHHQYQQPQWGKRLLYKKGNQLKAHFLIYQDVLLHLKLLMERLKKSEEQSRQIEKLKQDWISGVSHDLKAPLTYITSYAYMLSSPEYQWSQEEKQDFARKIYEKSISLEELIQDLNLSFQIDHTNLPLQYKKQNLVQFIRELIIDIANNPISAQYEFSFDSTQTEFEAEFDPKLFGRALHNLLINAVLHNPPRTKIQVQTTYQEQSVTVSIRDNGVGIDQSILDNLQTKKNKPSTNGLGLIIAKQLISAHQGTIQVESRKHKGTTFLITIPRYTKNAVSMNK